MSTELRAAKLRAKAEALLGLARAEALWAATAADDLTALTDCLASRA